MVDCMKKEFIDLDIVSLEWNEVQQHWHIQHKKEEHYSNWKVIAEEIDYRIAGAFCDWVEETKISASGNSAKKTSVEEMKEYWNEFCLILEILREREIIKELD